MYKKVYVPKNITYNLACVCPFTSCGYLHCFTLLSTEQNIVNFCEMMLIRSNN